MDTASWKTVIESHWSLSNDKVKHLTAYHLADEKEPLFMLHCSDPELWHGTLETIQRRYEENRSCPEKCNILDPQHETTWLFRTIEETPTTNFLVLVVAWKLGLRFSSEYISDSDEIFLETT